GSGGVWSTGGSVRCTRCPAGGPGSAGPDLRGAQYGAPQYGAPQYGAPQYGAPQSQPGQQSGWGQPMPGGGYTGAMTGPATPDGQPIASWGMRLLARIIDGIVVVIIGWAASLV